MSGHRSSPRVTRYLAIPMPKQVLDLEARVASLEGTIAHVLRYGRVGKQSEARLREALRGPGEAE